MLSLTKDFIHDINAKLAKDITMALENKIKARLEQLGHKFKTRLDLLQFAKDRCTLIIKDNKRYLYIDHDKLSRQLVCWWEDRLVVDYKADISKNKITVTYGG